MEEDGISSVQQEESLGQQDNYFSPTAFIDKHLRTVQNIPYALLGVGCLLIGRKLRLLTRFKSVDGIPNEFIKRQVSLRGCITRVSTDSTIYVRHIPIISFKKFKSIPLEGNDTKSIPLRLAGIRIDKENQGKVRRELEKQLHELVWFKLWHKELNGSSKSLHCLLYERKWPFNKCINLDLLKNGLVEYEPLNDYLKSPSSVKHTQRLVKAQEHAMKKRLGIWYEPTKLQGYSVSAKENLTRLHTKQLSYFASLKQYFKIFLSWFKRK